MIIKSKYRLFKIFKGKIHIQFIPDKFSHNNHYLCGLPPYFGNLTWNDKRKIPAKVSTQPGIICKKCLKKYYKETK